VTVSGSQKGLMRRWHQLQRTVAQGARSHQTQSFPGLLGLDEIRRDEQERYWPYTPNTNLLYGLSEALDMLLEEACRMYSRDTTAGRGCARCGAGLGLEIQCADPAVYSPVLTGVVLPRASMPTACVERSTSASTCRSDRPGKLKGRMFRIGHLATATTSPHGCPVGLRDGVKLSGVALAAAACKAAMDFLFVAPRAPALQAAGMSRAFAARVKPGDRPVPTHIPDCIGYESRSARHEARH